MKQTLFLLVGLVWGFTSCTTNDEDFLDQRAPREFKTSRFRSYDEALNIAKSAAKMVDDNTDKSRGVTTERTIDTKNGVKVVATPGSRSASPDTLMYVFNFADNEGFAVVSAAPEAEPLLAVTESGYYDPNEEQDNPGFAMYMDRAKEYVANSLSIGNPGTPSGPIWRNDTTVMGEMTILSDTIRTLRGPINNHFWGDHAPYGDRCPNGMAGCTQTAIGMIMAHFCEPQYMTFDYPELPVSYSTTIDWNLVNRHLGNSLCNDYAHQGDSLIARIIRQLGHDFGAAYFPYATQTSTTTALNVLHNKYGYTCSPLADYSTYDYRHELDEGAIGLVSSRHIYQHANILHNYLLNGYLDFAYKAKVYQLYTLPNMPSGVLYYSKLLREEDRLTAYWHLNWCFDGTYNGYYFSGVFDPNECQSSIFPIPDGEAMEYSYNQMFSFVKFRASRPGRL